ncbi:MAG: S-layer homology domain-containing protein [bacterium]|nr:S-layer homology domain-containing protein [bacterium]
MINQKIAASMAAVMAVSVCLPMTSEASSTFELRRKVVGMAGIMEIIGDMSENVSRGEFARMLVMATDYGTVGDQESRISVYSDVSQESEYAYYIQTAVKNGWMSGYLGGLFKPEQGVTLQEAAKGVLALLGYEDSDFSGNLVGGRMAKYKYLELNEDINREAEEILTRQDCVNLFYNLLKTPTKGGQKESSFYGKVLECSLTSDGEIDAYAMADNSLVGPKKMGTSLEDAVPFTLKKSNLFLDGEKASVSEIEDNAIVIYYHKATKSVWAYSDSDEEGKRGAATGTIEAIYYGSMDVMTPVEVEIEGRKYKLSSSDVQFAFSMYGDLRVGDEVTVIYEASDGDGETVYTVVDYMEE